MSTSWGSTVHPRARGERGAGWAIGAWTDGSSPRARGTAKPSQRNAIARRFIPARAGNGSTTPTPSCSATVHPRARGERRVIKHGAAREVRFIPARAGNGPSRDGKTITPPVHPRARGERPAPTWLRLSRTGSSPRARGTVAQGHSVAVGNRFIPARAGNWCPPMAPASLLTVHPRARGERSCLTSLQPSECGSSPRARGTVCLFARPASADRFIPARAGNGPPNRSAPKNATVHPRARGERGRPNDPDYVMSGSSPRARGTVLGHGENCHNRRFIPARAGNGRA